MVKGCVDLMSWMNKQDQCECTSCTVDRYWSLFTEDINKHLKSRMVTRAMCKRPLTLTFNPALCAFVSASVMTVASAVTSRLSDALPGVMTKKQ